MAHEVKADDGGVVDVDAQTLDHVEVPLEVVVATEREEKADRDAVRFLQTRQGFSGESEHTGLAEDVEKRQLEVPTPLRRRLASDGLELRHEEVTVLAQRCAPPIALLHLVEGDLPIHRQIETVCESGEGIGAEVSEQQIVRGIETEAMQLLRRQRHLVCDAKLDQDPSRQRRREVRVQVAHRCWRCAHDAGRAVLEGHAVVSEEARRKRRQAAMLFDDTVVDDDDAGVADEALKAPEIVAANGDVGRQDKPQPAPLVAAGIE